MRGLDLIASGNGIAAIISLLLCAWTPAGCKDDYPVQDCEPGQGLNLDNSGAPYLGELSAPVELTLFGDLECPYTRNLLLALNGFMDDLAARGKQGELKIQFRHLLRSNSPEYRVPAVSIAAAHGQGNPFIWGGADRLGMLWCYVSADLLDEQQIITCARTAGLDMDRFAQDRQDQSIAAIVEKDLALGRDIGFEGVPGVVLCGKQVSSDPDGLIDNIEYLIDD